MTERLGKMAIPPVRRRSAPPLDDRYMAEALALDELIYSPTKLHPRSQYVPRGPPYSNMDLLEPPLPRRRSYVDYDAVEDTQPLQGRDGPEFDLLFKDYLSAKQGGRPMHPAAPPRYKPASSSGGMDEDVFDLYEAPSRDRRPLPPPPSSSRFIPPAETHLSYEMRSRLEGKNSEPRSMGIFANPTKSSSASAAPKEYRVMVTNLHSSVTVWDIQELFADIGGLLSAAIIKPGVAEVVYKTMKDAEDAVEVYHNRQLDGQPMKCHLIAPPPVPSSSSSSGARKPPLELDLDTLHSALFTKKRR